MFRLTLPVLMPFILNVSARPVKAAVGAPTEEDWLPVSPSRSRHPIAQTLKAS